MNRRLNNFIAVLLVLCFCLFAPFFFGGASAPGSGPAASKVKAATHVIYTATITEEANCSATAVARHALLIASHCEAPVDSISIDGVAGYKIDGILRDASEHSILLISGADFKAFVPITVRDYRFEEKVFIWGNPSLAPGIVYVKQFRTGKYIGTHTHKGKLVDVVGFEGRHGDSGSGIFSVETGELLGVLSFIGQVPVPPAGEVQTAIGCVRLAFTKEQLDKAAKF